MEYFCRVLKKDLHLKRAISLKLTFLLKLCGDVLHEVLCFGNRQRLTALERVGRRFYRIVESFFPTKPFQSVNLTLHPAGFLTYNIGLFISCLSTTLNVLIGTPGTVLDSGLANIPTFVRINELFLRYNADEMPIETKCTLFLNRLDSSKLYVKNANTVNFCGRIVRHDECCFEDSSQLLKHLNKLIYVFSNACRFKFQLSFWSDEDMAGYTMGRILSIPEVYYSSNVEITFFCARHSTALPIKDISDWLHYNYTGKEGALRINLHDIVNGRELCKHLENVKHLIIHILIVCNLAIRFMLILFRDNPISLNHQMF